MVFLDQVKTKYELFYSIRGILRGVTEGAVGLVGVASNGRRSVPH